MTVAFHIIIGLVIGIIIGFVASIGLLADENGDGKKNYMDYEDI